jgi:DNA-binding MarR family transcriptional regulator
MTQQSMGELVAYLEQRGYVERRPDHHDRRARIVLPTEAGRGEIKAGTGVLVEVETILAERMGEGRLEELAGSLGELTALLAEVDSARVGSARKS